MLNPIIPRVGILGLGLMGGSLALALKQRKLCSTLVGYGRRQETLAQAISMGLIDIAADTMEALVSQSDLVVICTPLSTYSQIFQEITAHWHEHLIITDVGSVKTNITELAEKILPNPRRFVPGHPIAGSERSGLEAARADLFVDHRVILTPREHTDKSAYDQVRRLWIGVGAQVTSMALAEHDRVLAATSHLPHLLAFSLVDTLAGNPENQAIFRYAAGGFRDFTRIAASDPVMWRDICCANRTAIIEGIQGFQQGLTQLTQYLEQEQDQQIFELFKRAQSARVHFAKILARRQREKRVDFMNQHSYFIIEPGGQLAGDIRVPSDKSISHRSIMLGAIAQGRTEVASLLEGEDVLATLEAFRQMGVQIEGPDQGRVVIHGVGLKGLKKPVAPLYMGNSGTSMRLLSGLLAGQAFSSTLEGDVSLGKRPMQRIADPLTRMGADIVLTESGTAPVVISPAGAPLRGIHYAMPQASAQVKSSVLLAGLYAEGTTEVIEPAPTRDHTERMLRAFGYEVKTQGHQISLIGGGTLAGTQIQVPADISSAAFFMVGASIAECSEICLKQVGVNPTRVGVINILKAMGANIQLEHPRTLGDEPVADIRVRSAKLKGINIPLDQVPLAIDEFPAIFVAAACARGTTRLRGAKELRVKESDRIQVMADGLNQLGVEHQVVADGIDIIGGVATGGEIESRGDHRIAMSFAILGLRSTGPIHIKDCENVSTSFPGFVSLSSDAGLRIVGR